ncbi:unnamed protein product [Cunninghamella echinulata]
MLIITLAYASDESCNNWCKGRHLNNDKTNFVCCHAGIDDNANWWFDDCICINPFL